MPGALENRIPPPVLALGLGLLMGAAALVTPPLGAPLAARLIAGGALLAAGGVFAAPAFAAFASAGTTVDPVRIENATTLVTGGIYKFSRNPMYVALSLLLCALAAVLARPGLLAGPLVFVAFVTRFQILPEERAMRSKLGAAYEAYLGQVRRWL